MVSDYWLFDSHDYGERSQNLQETAVGYNLDATLIDRNSTAYVAPNLLNPDTWTSNFAMPPACITGEGRGTICVQLHRIAQREYSRVGPLFHQELDWRELLKHLPNERILVGSCWSVGVTGAMRHDWEWHFPDYTDRRTIAYGVSQE